jgi:hypothetical protein
MSLIGFPILALCLVAHSLPAQEALRTTYVLDANGRRVEWTAARAGDSSRSETVASLNGSRVPLEQAEEKVLEKSDGRLIVERTVRRRTPDGQALPPEKVRVETLTGSDGSVTETRTTYRGDLNGALAAAERSVSRSVKHGEHVRTETLLERPSLNGSFAVVERREAATQEREHQSETNVVVYRPDQNGRMAEAARQTMRASVVNGIPTEQSDEYENASTGQMRLSKQTVTRTVKNPDGAERREIDIFGPAAPGRPMADGKLELRERQIVDRTAMNGQVVERLSVQRPALDDARRLSRPQLVSETVCEGKCK